MEIHGKQPLWPASLIQWVACGRAVATSPEARGSGWRRWLGPAVRLSPLVIDSIGHSSRRVETIRPASCPHRCLYRLMCNVSACVSHVFIGSLSWYIPSLNRATDELSERRKCRTALRMIIRMLYLYGSWSLYVPIC